VICVTPAFVDFSAHDDRLAVDDDVVNDVVQFLAVGSEDGFGRRTRITDIDAFVDDALDTRPGVAQRDLCRKRGTLRSPVGSKP